ncbi:uncharacterized protein LOC108932272 [Arapaima gigas]
MPTNRIGRSTSGSDGKSRPKSSSPAKASSPPGGSREPARYKGKDTVTAKKTHQKAMPEAPRAAKAAPRSPQKDENPGARAGVRLPTPEATLVDIDKKLERWVVEGVEKKTRGQRENPQWFSWRQNRITASIAHSVSRSRFANGQSQTPPASYISSILGEGSRVMTRAMHWGVQKEAVAARQYECLKSQQLGRPVRVQECGLFVDPQRSWLAASPDGIVEDAKTSKPLLLLEIKCPYKHREHTVAVACEDPTFCLELGGEAGSSPQRYRLKTKHCYYTQVQCQMAVVGIHKIDFVIFTLKEMVIVPISFDAEFWENTLSKLEYFYKKGVRPRLWEKAQGIPALRPELGGETADTNRSQEKRGCGMLED